VPAERQPRILICDELAPEAMEAFRRRGLEPEVRTGLVGDELLAAVRDVDAIVVRSATKLTRPVLEAAERLRAVGRAGIGVDNIDLDTATERGVVVMNTPLGNATTTAELALALLLSLARHIPRADASVRAGSWKKKHLLGTEITGKTLGVVGLGRIGRIVAERGRGLGMRVIAHDPYLDKSESPLPGVELYDLDELLERVDFLTLHVPLTASTKNLISWRELAHIKPGARLVQASRGGVVDEEAVVDALGSGRLAGAAFDVFSQEPPPADSPLLAREDVIVTPHLGASSAEAQLRVAVDIAECISEFLLEGVATNAVNAPTVSPEALHELAPFTLLAEKLGSFLAQRIGGPIRKVEFTVSGEVTRLGIEHLRLAFLVGMLKDSLADGVNFVNAPSLAKERGILVLESQVDGGAYAQGEIRVQATERDGRGTHSVAGAVFGREPRIIQVEDIRLDLPPTGHLLVTRHQDRPGVLGRIGTLLGKHEVNIRRMELGPPHGKDGLAYGFLTLESQPAAEVMDAIRDLDGLDDVSLLHL
jgi:D-3-phosphoglycerate dehydrogenase